MLLILVALVSPLAALDDQLVWVHMAQHLVLGDLAALLIVLGLTGPLLQPVLATRGLGWLRVLEPPGGRPAAVARRPLPVARSRPL